MKFRRISLSALLIGASALAIISCAERSPLAPAPQTAGPNDDLLGGLLTKTGLVRCSPLAPALAVATIGTSGGTMQIGPHTFTVPAGALSHNVTITAYSPSSDYNQVEFQPEGLQFQTSASLTMSYANCNLLGILLPKHIAYVDNDLNILYLLQSVDNIGAQKVTGKVDHFSDYIIGLVSTQMTSRILGLDANTGRRSLLTAVRRAGGSAARRARERERAGCIPEAVASYEEAIAAAERAGERRIEAEALRRLAVVRHQRHERDRAHALCEQCLGQRGARDWEQSPRR